MKPFEFQSVLFNFHDVMLLMTAMQCLFFAVLLIVTNTNRVKSTLFLSGFLLAHTLIPTNELIMWGAEFKSQVRYQWPQIYFIPAFAYYIDGPLLFLCIKSLVFKDFSLRRIDLLHLLPLLCYILFLSLNYYTCSLEQRQLLLQSESFVYSSAYVNMELASKLLRVFYAISCFVLISKYKDLLQNTNSNLEKSHVNWLTGLVIGFMVVMISEAILVAAKVVLLYFPYYGYSVFTHIGLTGNYATFALVNLLVFTATRHFLTFEQVIEEEDSQDAQAPQEDQFVNPEMAATVDEAMLKDKPFMEPDITLDTLAESLSILPRDLSMLINRHFGINFYEFINKYRIEEAKKMLATPEHKNTTITDIYLAVGFNSKSVFYTFFKKFEGITPSQFRQAALTG